MIVRFNCTECKTSAKAEVDADKAPPWLDPRALAMRLLVKRHGWRYQNGKIGKSVIDMVCPLHRDPEYFEADFDPQDVVPGTWESDCAITIDDGPGDAHS